MPPMPEPPNPWQVLRMCCIGLFCVIGWYALIVATPHAIRWTLYAVVEANRMWRGAATTMLAGGA